jgi:hypothetical protein
MNLWLIITLKWLSQVLILASGVSGLFSDLYKEDEITAKRTLTRSGWIHLAMIVVGFAVFGFTNFAEQREQKKKAADDKALIEIQKGQLQRLHRLDLARVHLAGLRLSVDLDDRKMIQKVRSLFLKAFKQTPGLHDVLDEFAPCFANNSINPKCNLTLQRRQQGDILAVGQSPFDPFSEEHPFSFAMPSSKATWSAIEKVVVDEAFKQLEILGQSNTPIVSLKDRSIIQSISLVKGALELVIEGRNLTLDQINDAHIRLRAFDPDPGWIDGTYAVNMEGDGPKKIHIQSTDPKVVLDQTFELEWTDDKISYVGGHVILSGECILKPTFPGLDDL